MKRTILNSCFSLLSASILLTAGFGLNSCTKEANNSNISQSVNAEESLSLASVASSGIDTAALVGWYDFNGGNLHDKSSYHNDIKFNNAQLTADRNGAAHNAYYFGGHNYMRVPNSASLNPDKAITMFAIVKVADFYEGKCHANRILDKGYNDQQPGVYYLTFDDGFYTHQMNCSQDVDKEHEFFSGGYGNFNTGRFNAEGDTTAFIQNDHWYHLVYTFAKGVGHFYVNGKLTQTNTGSVQFSGNGDDLYIGAGNQYNSQYPYWFTGTIDQIAIFNVALNAEQVARLSSY